MFKSTQFMLSDMVTGQQLLVLNPIANYSCMNTRLMYSNLTGK
jgi:hypothetical protein